MQHDITKKGMDPDEIVERVEKQIMEMMQNVQEVDATDIRIITDQRFQDYQEMFTNPDRAKAMKIHTHYRNLDNAIGGFQPGQFIIIAGRPAMGKTAFAINI